MESSRNYLGKLKQYEISVNAVSLELSVWLDGDAPLVPNAGRFTFSPSAVNRILGTDTTPSVLKKGSKSKQTRRSFTPLKSYIDESPAISPIINYTVPVNSPADLGMPPPRKRIGKMRTSTQSPSTTTTPTVRLVDTSGLKQRQRELANAAVTPTNGCGTSDTSSSSLDPINISDSSFDAVVGFCPESPATLMPSHPADHAHLDEHMSVVNILDDISLGHLGPIFERQEVRILK